MSEITMEALMRAKEKEMEETLPAQEPAEEALIPQERKRVDEIKKEIDFLDPQTDVQYGVGAQRNIADFPSGSWGRCVRKTVGRQGSFCWSFPKRCVIPMWQRLEIMRGSWIRSRS